MGSFAVLRPKSRPLYYLAFELKIKLQQVTPASAFCNSDTSIARTRNLRFSRRAHVLGKEAGKITTLLSRSAFAAGARAGVRYWSFAAYKATLNRMETSIFTRLRHSFVTQRQSGSDRPTIPKPKADSLLPLRAESSASSDQSLPIVHRPESFARRLASPSALQKREPPCPTAFPAGTISYSN